MRPFVQLCSAIVLLGVVSDAHALDKQGSAHRGQLEGATEGFDVEGAVVLGIALYNPSYAARPANTGLALFRYAVHADFDLIGRRLSIPLDLNMFTDGTRSGLRKLIPSEGDVITGVTSTWRVGPGALESGLRSSTTVHWTAPPKSESSSPTTRPTWTLACGTSIPSRILGPPSETGSETAT